MSFEQKLEIYPINCYIKNKIIADLKFSCIVFLLKKNGKNWKSGQMYKKFLSYLIRQYPQKIKVSRIAFKIYYESVPINLGNMWSTLEKELINKVD